MYKQKVREYYREAVRLKPDLPDELRTALRTHDRVPLFIDNLAVKFHHAQEMRLMNKKPPFSDRQLKDLVYDMVDTFIYSIKEQAKEMHESEINKKIREAKVDQYKELEETSKGNPQGEFAEAGLQVIEDRTIED